MLCSFGPSQVGKTDRTITDARNAVQNKTYTLVSMLDAKHGLSVETEEDRTSESK
jgi:hypothetical protein